MKARLHLIAAYIIISGCITLIAIAAPTLPNNGPRISKDALENSVFQYYTLANEGLVAEDYSRTLQAALNLQSSIIKAPIASKSKKLLQAVTLFAAAKNLEDQREQFKKLSISMWEYLKQTKQSSSKVYYQYCPMAKAYWVSEISEIRNPYYGSNMLDCGRTVESR